MIPSQRLYFLLLLGIAIAIILAIIWDEKTSILITLLFDILILLLAVWDGQRVKSNAVKVTRYPLQRLSIGRDNPVVLSVQSGKQSAKIRLRDYYPLEFQVSKPILETTIDPGTNLYCASR